MTSKFWVPFVRKFVTQTFPKQPNLISQYTRHCLFSGYNESDLVCICTNQDIGMHLETTMDSFKHVFSSIIQKRVYQSSQRRKPYNIFFIFPKQKIFVILIKICDHRGRGGKQHWKTICRNFFSSTLKFCCHWKVLFDKAVLNQCVNLASYSFYSVRCKFFLDQIFASYLLKLSDFRYQVNFVYCWSQGRSNGGCHLDVKQWVNSFSKTLEGKDHLGCLCVWC